MSKELLTIKEIARRLGLPESNIRYYRDKFDKFLPSVGEGRKKRFRPEALEVFEIIVQELAHNKSTAEIEERLSRMFSQNPSQVTGPEGDLRPPAQGDYVSRESASLEQALAAQSRALDQLSRAVHLERDLYQELGRVRSRQDKLHKAVYLLWKNYKKSLGGKQGSPGGNGEELEDLRQEIREISSRQDALEEWVKKELSEMHQELKRCQFWTKRLLLQTSQSQSDSDSGQDTDYTNT